MTVSFGTDGVRGLANAELTPELALSLGRAAARVLGAQRWVVGRDTRISGPMLQAALAAGLASAGADVVDLGVLPTPAVAATAAATGAAGAMVSASHNAFPDNGIKLFAPGGRKLADAAERELEAAMGDDGGDRKVVAEVGRFSTDHGAAGRYRERLVGALGGRSLEGQRVVLDCANGAASTIAGDVFRSAGAEVVVLHAQPDGTNINHGCGSTHPEILQAAVREAGDVDLGLAFDGDADRVLAVDRAGALVDGDQILALAALDLRRQGRLARDTLVVTVMSNLGLRLAMEAAGVQVVETKVGDRYVLEALEEGGFSLGGEQSGHIIFADLATTGDGLLTGLLLADIVRRSGEPLDRLAAAAMTRLPQVLHSVRVTRGADLDGAAAVWDEVAVVEQALSGAGRVLLRPSGTEPVVRVMVEAPARGQAEEAAARIAAAVRRYLGA